MLIGAVYPQIETKGDPATLEQIALAVESMGYEHLLMYDHVVGAQHADRDPPLWGPYNEKDPFHDPLMAFAYLAGITKRLRFMTGILVLPQRQTALLAKQVTDLDLMSGQRFTLGVGTGWNYIEYLALGQNFHERGKRMDEQIPYIRQLWSQPLVTFEGKFDSLVRGAIVPRPKRQIPIYCGGYADAAYRRAARLADGFIFAASLEQTALPGLARIKELLAENDRSVDDFGKHYIIQDHRARGLDVDAVIAAANLWRDAGGTGVSVCTMGCGYDSPQAHIDFLAEVKHRLGD